MRCVGLSLVGLLALTGCLSWEPVAGDRAPTAASPEAAATDARHDSRLAPAPSAAATHLVAEARDAAAAGRLDDAAATIERALRIDQGNPWLMIELAKIRLLEGRAQESDALAARARSLAPGDKTLQRAAWRTTADARSALGDADGVTAAQRAVDALDR